MYQRPFVTSRYTAYAGDSLVRRLSLAVLLTDEVTGRAPAGSFQVLLKERRPEQRRGQEPIRNQSGFFCFLDIPDGNYTIVVEPGAESRLYSLRPAGGGPGSTDRVARSPCPCGPLEPVVELTLSPTPSYRFSSNATLVRGTVLNNGIPPAPGAVVRCLYQRAAPTVADPDATSTAIVESRTDIRGHYVLFFSALSPAQQNVNVRAAIAGQPPNNQTTTIREGRTAPNIDIAFP